MVDDDIGGVGLGVGDGFCEGSVWGGGLMKRRVVGINCDCEVANEYIL